MPSSEKLFIGEWVNFNAKHFRSCIYNTVQQEIEVCSKKILRFYPDSILAKETFGKFLLLRS